MNFHHIVLTVQIA